MVLTVDIGNTNIVLGVFDQDELVFTARVSTDKEPHCGRVFGADPWHF